MHGVCRFPSVSTTKDLSFLSSHAIFYVLLVQHCYLTLICLNTEHFIDTFSVELSDAAPGSTLHTFSSHSFQVVERV